MPMRKALGKVVKCSEKERERVAAMLHVVSK